MFSIYGFIIISFCRMHVLWATLLVSVLNLAVLNLAPHLCYRSLGLAFLRSFSCYSCELKRANIKTYLVGYWSERGKIRVSNPVSRSLSLYFICCVVSHDSWLSTSPFPLNRPLCYRITPKLYLQRPVFLWNLQDGCMQKGTAFFQKLTSYVNTVCWSM